MSKSVARFFVNKNPRNLEFLRLQPRDWGHGFEKDRAQRQFIYKAELVTSGQHSTAFLTHYRDGVVLTVSTRDPAISSQLYSNVDTSAASNIGRVLAKCCLSSGIKSCIMGIDEKVLERSKRRKAFFDALQQSGMTLHETDCIPRSSLNDPNYTFQHYPVQHNRQDKLDELFDQK